MEFDQTADDIFSFCPPSQSKDDSFFHSQETILRAHRKTLAIEQPNDDGLINAIDRLLQNLPPLPNEKALITRDYKLEVELSSGQKLKAHMKAGAIEEDVEGPINAIDRLLQGLPALEDGKEKALIKRSDAWEADTCCGSGSDDEGTPKKLKKRKELQEDEDGYLITLSRASTLGIEENKTVTSESRSNIWTLDRCREAEGMKVCAKCGTTHGAKEEKSATQDVTSQRKGIPEKLNEVREASRKEKEKEKDHMPSIDDEIDDGYPHSEHDWRGPCPEMNNGSRHPSWQQHGKDDHKDGGFDAGSEAESEPYIVYGPLKRWQIEYFEGSMAARLEQRRREEEENQRRWSEELWSVGLLRTERQQRRIGRPERRIERQKRREDAVGLAAQREIQRYHAIQTSWTPAMMPRLPSERCVELKDSWRAENEVIVEEAEWDTETEAGDIEPSWSYQYSPELVPVRPEGIAVYDWARKADIMLQEETHQWNKLRAHHEENFRSRGRATMEGRNEGPHSDTEASCTQCAEVHTANILPSYGPWWRDRAIAPSRDSDRECRATVDGIGLGARRIQVPRGLARRATGREDDDDDVVDNEGGDSESEDGNHGNDGTNQPKPEDFGLTPEIIPPSRPPVLNYDPYRACDDVQNELRSSFAKEVTDPNEIRRINGELEWKTSYLDLKMENSVLNDYKDYVDDRIESVAESSSMAAERQREMEFWEGLYEELEVDQWEVAQDLDYNNEYHRKGAEEYKEMAVAVHKSFVKNMKKPVYSAAWAMYEDDEDEFHSAHGDNETPDSSAQGDSSSASSEHE